MNYRHAFHAGNFADVVKHVALVAILLHLRKKDKPFRVIDTHAGRGLYDLGGEEALRTGEAASGIARLRDLDRSTLPKTLATYLELVERSGNDRYPGSPLIAAQILRENDRLIAIEQHADEEAALRRVLHPFGNAKSICADGYARLASLLPPPERRGIVLVDPPFEAEDEFERLAQALAAALRRFATGIYLVWHPVKSKAQADALKGEVLAAGASEILQITVDVGRASEGDKERLSAAGLLVVNPPFGFLEDVREAASFLAPRMGRAKPARFTFEQSKPRA